MRILFVFGTRPEAIKLAPLIATMAESPSAFETKICVSGQHREMLDQVLSLFRIEPDHDLRVMREAQNLAGITASVVTGLTSVLAREQFDRVIVQGDTTTTFAASLAAFYARVPVAHVEAGLRSDDPLAPWPEEINRSLTARIADLHFAPTEEARRNLLRENVPADRIHVTGNTGIDALLDVLARIRATTAIEEDLDARFSFLDATRKLVLVTGHRRENFGDRLDSICRALADVALLRENVEILYPLHLNPNVRQTVTRTLAATANGSSGRIHLIDPVDYVAMVYLMNRSHLILTDSGGIQEEAPSLGKPVLVMREKTERPEGVEAGTVRLVGTDRERIVGETMRILDDDALYRTMSRAHNPYGDGKASRRIAAVLAASA